MVEKNDGADSVWDVLEQIADPEIPVLSLLDLGIVKTVEIDDKNCVIVTITPTYSACPAVSVMRQDIVNGLKNSGFDQVVVKLQNHPVWTTDFMSESAHKKLLAYGIAPPQSNNKCIACPQCNSHNVECLSEFGSTACKALYRCNDCLEPFDYFKCHV